MPRKPKTIVLDSWAIMSYLQGEPSAEKVADTIADAHEDNVPLLMSVVNAGEVWYIIARRTSEADADRSIRELKQLGIELVDAGWEIAQEAGRFKAKHKMSFADCFAAALAKQRKAHLVTGDQEFKQVEADVIINWLK
ncbi:MAG: type II toxin-antitoxin system VapC family toxin [Pyrinomonadaceae bacterium]|jgi:ribonuclease VapC|nr:type II toxin-antitoxin system VapC family toxin [Pyrinomonadaceae bacterium]